MREYNLSDTWGNLVDDKRVWSYMEYLVFFASRNKRIYRGRRWRNMQSISPVSIHAMKIINRNFVV